jgi:oligopeptidase B
MARSADGTEIPYYVLKHGSKSQGLLVIGYGAYGIPTSFMTARWTPLLKQGWAIAIGLWRGGGDHTPEWEDSGRRYGRIKVLDDAEAVVKAARAFTQVPAKRTVLYGRSAGGLWVGGLAAKHPQGDLAGGAYMEMPYLDVLRTTTNRTLPLTNIETDEFGLPEKRLSDFIGMLEWSPMELIGRSREEIPGMWQIIRTATNDSEVFAYESAKWVARSKNAFLALGDGGHFTGSIETQAEDLSAILHLTLEN